MPPAGSPLDPSYSHIPRPPPSGRRAGIILHPTSLPGPHGVGDLGPQAFAFVDFLAAAGVGAWQVLPLVPPETAFWSPYVGRDALCGSTLLLSPEALVEDGLVGAEDAAEALRSLPRSAGRGVGGRRGTKSVDYPAASKAKAPLLLKAARSLVARARKEGSNDALASEMRDWRARHGCVEDSALFDALSSLDPECSSAVEWWSWPEPLRYRHDAALSEARSKYSDAIDEFVALQFLFDRQWQALKTYANSKEVILVGDMPIYVGGHSADVWAHRHLFALGDDGSPRAVSGVPPDAFSDTGQLWGSPLYDWPAHQREGFSWWARRLERARELYDLTRVDHFRAFAGYWSVPGTAQTAMEGSWISGPGKELFDAVSSRIGHVAIIAEDLGVITPDVTELRLSLGAPGMAVLQFAWGSDASNPHLPHNHTVETVAYPGTHDNETCLGWWEGGSANANDKKNLLAYLGKGAQEDPAGALVRAAAGSVARLAIFQMQDALRLGNDARMNFPGTAGGGNWGWRVPAASFSEFGKEAAELRHLMRVTGRIQPLQEKVEDADAAAGVAALPGAAATSVALKGTAGGSLRAPVGRALGWLLLRK